MPKLPLPAAGVLCRSITHAGIHAYWIVISFSVNGADDISTTNHVSNTAVVIRHMTEVAGGTGYDPLRAAAGEHPFASTGANSQAFGAAHKIRFFCGHV